MEGEVIIYTRKFDICRFVLVLEDMKYEVKAMNVATINITEVKKEATPFNRCSEECILSLSSFTPGS